MKLFVALFGIGAGVVVALGQLSAAQWHAAGVGLLALTLRYGLTVLPWLLAGLLAALWRRERRLVGLWRASYKDQTTYYAARMAEVQEAAAHRPQQRRRPAR